jgi:hypothetical protein
LRPTFASLSSAVSDTRGPRVIPLLRPLPTRARPRVRPPHAWWPRARAPGDSPPAYLRAADSAAPPPRPQALAPPPVRQTLVHSAATEPCRAAVLDPLRRRLPVIKE